MPSPEPIRKKLQEIRAKKTGRPITKDEDKLKPVSVQLRKDERDKLQEIAIDQDCSVSWLIRQAVRGLISNFEDQEKDASKKS